MNLTLADDWLITCDLSTWRDLATWRPGGMRIEPDGFNWMCAPCFMVNRCWISSPVRLLPRINVGKIRRFQRSDGTTKQKDSRQFSRDEELVRKLHADWLLTPRAELAGNTRRHLLFATRLLVERNLNYRELNWSFLGHRTPAYRRH